MIEEERKEGKEIGEESKERKEIEEEREEGKEIEEERKDRGLISHHAGQNTPHGRDG